MSGQAAERPVKIGVDFDNTIISYDALFHRVGHERELIPADLPANKADVRNHLRAAGREDAWTEMQGHVYGSRMLEAEAYPGAVDFFRACHARGVDVCIVSHKTRYPFLGEQHDLHAAARGWLEAQGFFDPLDIALPRDRAFFELTKEAKLARIAAEGCTHFVDDLPEILGASAFPPGVARVLFDPGGVHADEDRFARAGSWGEIRARLWP